MNSPWNAVEMTSDAADSDARAHARQAESLIRSLAGIDHADVYTDDDGRIVQIRVTATNRHAAASAARDIRSALLALFGRAPDEARISVSTATDNDVGATPDPNEEDARDADAGRAGRLARARAARDTARPRDDGEDERADDAPSNTATARPDTDHDHDPRPGATAASNGTNGSAAPAHAAAGPRLVSVDVGRVPPNRVAVSVTVAVGTDIHRAAGEALDLPGAAAHAAAQAAVNALADGGVLARLDGVREIEISGRDYVVVALQRPDAARPPHAAVERAGDGAERAAARAAVAAARTLP